MIEEQIKWSQYPFVLGRLLELDARGYTQGEIASLIRIEYPEIVTRIPSRDQIKNALAYARGRAQYLSDKPIADITPYLTKYKNEIEGSVPIEKTYPVLGDILAKSKRKVLVISDLHVPFLSDEKLQKAIELNRSADMVVVAGDLMDCYSQSRWRKTESIPFEVELDQTVRLLEYLSQTFPWVRIIRGNHDERVLKKIRDVISPELLYLFDNEPLDLLVKPFPNVEYMGEWWTVVGDAIIAHAERSSAIEGRPAVLLSQFFNAKGWRKRLNLPEIRCFITGHTHQVSAVYQEDIKMFETGCLAQVMDYTLDSKAFMRPPMNGCVTLVQVNDRTDFNESREWVL